MSNDLTSWDEVRQLADEIEVQMHLATMESRERWALLKPRVEDLERRLVQVGERISGALLHELADLRAALARLRDDLILRARGDYVTGW